MADLAMGSRWHWPVLPERDTPQPMRFLGWFLGCLSVLVFPASAETESSSRPNFVVILADDLGYSDLGCYGGEIRTPNLDALAKAGLRFTQTYNSSRCCPSRASLLTGLYPHQAGIGRFVGDGKLEGYRGRLNERCVTLGEVLGAAGYTILACGKWHVNTPGPIERGFDEFYGFVHGYGVDSWNPSMMIRLPEGRPQREYGEGSYFATDAITDHALDFLQDARKEDQPWLLYLAYQAPHFPVQAPPELTETYLSTYADGWDAIREKRLGRMKTLGLIDREMELPPRGPIDLVRVAKRIGSMTEDGRNPAWDSLDQDRQADLARRMAVYAAMVENMDQNIGRVVEDLRQSGELENTLILFLSDNGACAEWEPYGFDLDASEYEGRPPGHGINSGTPGKPNVLHRGKALASMGGPGSLFSYGCGWANVSNTPLALYKHYAHEGGIRTPMIAHWPAGISDKGELRPHVSHVMDVMPTLVELARAGYPGEPIQPIEGRSLLPAFEGKPATPRSLLFEHERNIAWRVGDWKLVGEKGVSRDTLREEADWRLYDLSSDPAEQVNLAAKHPERVASMKQDLLKEAKRTRVLPAP